MRPFMAGLFLLHSRPAESCSPLQGSSDGKTWVTLRAHVNDNTVNLPGQYASWPVTGHAALFPYRMFRLLLTGPNSSKRNNMCVSYLEFYGYFLMRNNLTEEDGPPASTAQMKKSI